MKSKDEILGIVRICVSPEGTAASLICFCLEQPSLRDFWARLNRLLKKAISTVGRGFDLDTNETNNSGL
jgi:hypothetical protein